MAAGIISGIAKYFKRVPKIIAGECSTPGVISVISCCNDQLVKKKLEINEESNILIIGCEGDTDKNLYNKLYKIGNQKLKKYD